MLTVDPWLCDCNYRPRAFIHRQMTRLRSHDKIYSKRSPVKTSLVDYVLLTFRFDHCVRYSSNE